MHKNVKRIYRPKLVKFALNLWPPFFGAGIRIVSISDDFCQVKVKLKLRWWNKNANRTQYGGSIFSLTDPVYSLMLMGILGEKYFVWDKEASINYIAPGKSNLSADFFITKEVLDEIYSVTRNGDKHFPEFITHIKDKDGNIISEVKRKLYVRKKPQFRDEN